MAALRHKNVRRLDVAMNDRLRVCGTERVSDVDGKRQNQFGFLRTPSNAMLQCEAVQELHSDERFAVLIINLMDRANVRMIECRCGLSFASKTGECLRIARYLIRQEL